MKKYKTDRELVTACLQGKRAAQRALYDKHVQAMYNTVYRYTGSHHDTQDILQNGFTRVFKYLKKYDIENGNLLGWIRRIHINCALDFIKASRIFFEAVDETTLFAIHSVEVDKLEAEYILQFIEELNPRDRVIFNMFHIEGYSHQEIAEQLSININSSRAYLARARKILRDKISAHRGRLSLSP